MKFGKRLLREQSSDWREHYICYKARAGGGGGAARAGQPPQRLAEY